MISDRPDLLQAIRDRFAHIDTCPFTGPRVFFENAGGALHLKTAVETSAFYAAIPDNQGRDNAASKALVKVIDAGKADMRLFLNAPGGTIFVGETGSEVLFRLIRTAITSAPKGSICLGTTLEHPASASAMTRWAGVMGLPVVRVPHDDATGTVTAEAYAAHVTPDVAVATIIHTSPVTGMAVDIAAVARAIRATAPKALIVVDGIQHASHGAVDVAEAGIDGYAVSPYKVFSRHGYGFGWASDRLTACDKDQILGNPATSWELGTRDTGSYATFTDVVDYLDWLGSEVSPATDRRARVEAAASAIKAQEAVLARAVLSGTGNLPGLADLPGVTLVGGAGLEAREGVVSFALDTRPAAEVTAALEARGVRVHTRKADNYSGNVLTPLGLPACVRVSFSHYNTLTEVAQFLTAMQDIAQTEPAAAGA
jgi:selenocysteine lyase/cysteine desulfurase